MKINRNKVKKAFKKVLVGIKSGYKETEKFVDTYGPPAHNRFNRVATGIQETFEVRPGPRAVRPDFTPRPFRKFPGLIDKRRRRRKVDWDNLGMEF